MKRHQEQRPRSLFRGDAIYSKPELYQYPEHEKIVYAIRFSANGVLLNRSRYFKDPMYRDISLIGEIQDEIQNEKKGHIAYFNLNRPKLLNVYHVEMCQ